MILIFGVVLVTFVILGVYWAYFIYRFTVLNKYGNISALIFQIFSLLLQSSWILITCILHSLNTAHSLLIVFQFFSVFSSQCLILECFYCYFFKFSNFYFAVGNILLISHNVYFISAMVQIKFRFFLYLPCPLLYMFNLWSVFLSVWNIFITTIFMPEFIISIICFFFVPFSIDFSPYYELYFPALCMRGNFYMDHRHNEFYLDEMLNIFILL